MSAMLILIGLAIPVAFWFAVWSAVRHGPYPSRWRRNETLFGYACGVGLPAFAAGFFGPMILAPGANQGPLLGLLITGPGGFLGGLLWGIIRLRGRRNR